MTSKFDLAAVISRIERAPNIDLLMRALDVADPRNGLTVERVPAHWALLHDEFEVFTGTFEELRQSFVKIARQMHSDSGEDDIVAQLALALIPQPAQQARDLRGPPEPREIRVTALGHLGHACDPASPEACLWIVTDGRLSRDCASHQEALNLAEDFRGWGYVVPAMVPQPFQQQQACAGGPRPEPVIEPAPVSRDYVADMLDELVQEDADEAEIAAIGPLGGQKYAAPGRDGIDVFDDGDDSKPYMTIPRGLPAETARLLIDYWDLGYRRGLKNGASEIQRGMRRLLGVSVL